ncbi:heterodisulfide reductase-related iron-sulfur binding cluster [Micromonospora sp. LOL_025]|uniref:heterodisulfide reductase-related iron-sulfur binding cluster n=1 Tax=Micromonospora sp. LOL_025 TaxID=3345413 RepID=UPI003A892EA6
MAREWCGIMEVVFPEGQTCCGQMHVNTGYPGRRAAPGPPARPHVRTFAPYDVVVAPSGSCVWVRCGTSTPW